MRAPRLSAGLTTLLGLALGAASAFAPVAVPGPAFAAEDQKEIVATTVRQHGYVCEKPKRAERDEEASSPDEPVWVIECENGSYRVKYLGGGDPQVKPPAQ